MAHFAKLDNDNKVLEIHVVNNASLNPENEEISGVAFLTDWSGGYTNWKQTSFNNNFRKQYAGIGYAYDPVADVFISPQPYPSWSLDENFDWQAPKEKPDGFYIWDEDLGDWVEYEA